MEVTKSDEKRAADLYAHVESVVGKTVRDALKGDGARDLIDTLRERTTRESPDKELRNWRAIRAIVASGAKSLDAAARYVRDSWGDRETADYMDDIVSRQLGAGDATAGGTLLPTPLAAEIIELLRPRVVVRALGAEEVPMPEGSIEIPRITGGAAVGFTGENAARSATQLSTGSIVMTAKHLVGITPVSNQLIRSPSANADRLVRNDLVRGIATREDLAFIRDDGTANTPKGIKFWAGKTVNANTTPTASTVISEAEDALTSLEAADVPLEGAAWIMAPRTRNFLRTVRGVDVFLFRTELDAGRWFGLPVGVTSQIPTNLDASGAATNDESEVFLVWMRDAMIGQTGAVEVAASDTAAYNDSSGAVVAPFSRNQTVVRVIESIDFAMRHNASAVMIDRVRWGV